MRDQSINDLLKANHEIWNKKAYHEQRAKIAVAALELIIDECKKEPVALSIAKLALEKVKAIK